MVWHPRILPMGGLGNPYDTFQFGSTEDTLNEKNEIEASEELIIPESKDDIEATKVESNLTSEDDETDTSESSDNASPDLSTISFKNFEGLTFRHQSVIPKPIGLNPQEMEGEATKPKSLPQQETVKGNTTTPVVPPRKNSMFTKVDKFFKKLTGKYSGDPSYNTPDEPKTEKAMKKQKSWITLQVSPSTKEEGKPNTSENVVKSQSVESPIEWTEAECIKYFTVKLTVDSALHDLEITHYFFTFLKSLHATEGYQFCHNVESFQKQSKEKLRAKALQIFDIYIKTEGLLSVNLPSDMRRELSKKIDIIRKDEKSPIEPNFFDGPYGYVKSLMKIEFMDGSLFKNSVAFKLMIADYLHKKTVKKVE